METASHIPALGEQYDRFLLIWTRQDTGEAVTYAKGECALLREPNRIQETWTGFFSTHGRHFASGTQLTFTTFIHDSISR